MNKEQIEKLWNIGSELLNRPIGSSKEFRTEDVRPVFDLALASIWHPFGVSIQSSWPKEDWYLIYQQKEYHWNQNGGKTFHKKKSYRIAYFERGRWYQKRDGLNIYWDVTHYQPIIPPKDVA